MKEKVLLALMAHGKMRRRVIAGYVRVWTAAPELTDALLALEKEGKIKRTYHQDFANMDCYYEWEVI